MIRKPQILTFYSPMMSPKRWSKHEPSQSPIKPRLLFQYLVQQGLLQHFITNERWKPFRNEEFLIAHDPAYVEVFFAGVRPLCESNGLSWSRHFAESVRYTNASLYHAIEYAVLHPEFVTISPTSGFHHALFGSGSEYCTFAGQVIASLKIYEKYSLSGAHIDLDAHYGNSIEAARSYNPLVTKAIPTWANLNPNFLGEDYIDDFVEKLEVVRKGIENGEIHYLVFCHGADSHIYDDLGGHLETEQWLRCSRIFYEFVRDQCPPNFPLTLFLSGGYRKDDYKSVLSLHTADLAVCLEVLLGQPVDFQVNVKERNELKWPEGGEQW